MTAAATIASDLDRRFRIAVERSGIVYVHDAESSTPCDGWPVYSAHTREAADELVQKIAVRTREGDGWILRRPWIGDLRDLGELRAELGRLYCGVLGERGASW